MTQTTELHLVLDIGTTGTKAALLTSLGDLVASAYDDYETFRGTGGIVEQNAHDWWRAVQSSVRALASSRLSNITAVVLTGQMQNLTLLGASGEPLRPTLLYSDTRASKEAERLSTALRQTQLRNLTGNDQDASSLLAKLLWIEANDPSSREATAYLFLGAADTVAFWLTGVARTDTTTASTTGLLDLSTRTFLRAEVFETLGLSAARALLPDLVTGGARVGSVTQHAAHDLGLVADIPVYLAPGDAGATTIGAGSGEIGPAYAYIGTSGWVALTADHRADPATGSFTLAHPHAERFIQVAPLLTAGGNLQWVRDLFDEHTYAEVIAQAFASPVDTLLYLPYLNGERSPIRDPMARGAFVGLSSRTDQAALYRAVLEGVVYGYRHALRALSANAPKSLVLAGGGTRSSQWCELFATIIGVPVHVLDNPEQVGLYGAHQAMRAARGDVSSYEVTLGTRTFQPILLHQNHYNQLFGLYLELYPALREVFRKLA